MIEPFPCARSDYLLEEGMCQWLHCPSPQDCPRRAGLSEQGPHLDLRGVPGTRASGQRGKEMGAN